jgi:hypothetical protein
VHPTSNSSNKVQYYFFSGLRFFHGHESFQYIIWLNVGD